MTAIDGEGQIMLEDRDSAALANAYQACLRLQHIRTPERLSQEIASIVEGTLGYEKANVFLVDEVAGRLKPFTTRKRRSSDEQTAQSGLESTPIRIGEGVVGSVAKSGQAVRIGDVRKESRYIDERENTRSLLCVPMRVGDRVIGVISVNGSHLDAFSDRDEEVVSIVADQVGVAIENANLFSQIRRYAAEQEQRVAARTSELESVIAQLEQLKVERKITAEALRLSDERFRSLVERLPIIIYTTERISSRRTLYVSPEVERKLGYSPTEWTSKTVLWFASLHPDDRDRVLNAIANAKASEERWLSMEYRLFGRDGQVFWFRDEAELIRDDGGRRFALDGLMLDITDQKLKERSNSRLMKELDSKNEDLQAQNDGLSAFSHMVAHDLKNPLAILLGFAELLRQDYGAGDDLLLSQGVTAIADNGLRMQSIIDELLLLAEVQQIEDIALEALDMTSIVNETQKRLSHLIDERDATVIVPAAWPTALGHKPWVQEIWVNYLSNAIIHGGRPPRLELGAMVQQDGMARFWVQDNGPGISREDRLKLFEPFTKLYEVQSEGHGLGLSIVHRIATKLGGSVGVDSERGDGSIFWFTLPMVQESTS
ncbi:MAG TPA: ATP-binding protein [candidate division Zixibacteria bacterium]|nr:ATP-binding protein [candidate division Zixibacteria bacterium]